VADEPGGRRPRILHIIPHDGVGGVEVAARSMAERTDLGCDFTLLLLAGETLAEDRSKVVTSPYRSALNPLAHLRAIRLCLRARPDVLVMSLWRSVGVGVLACLLSRRTRLVYFLNLDRPAHFVDAVAARIAIACSDEVWGDSDATLATRIGTRRKATRVISFVTERRTVPAALPGVRPHFVTWSRLNRQKGIDRALHFIATLRKSGIDATFDIWGPDDGERSLLEGLAKNLNIVDSVAFRGLAARETLPGIAAEAGFFLQLSRFEGMAMGTVEAMQLGLVPVVTPVGEMARYVQDELTGVVVDPDQLDQAAAKVAAVLHAPGAYGRLRAGAVRYWQEARLYPEDVCAAARDLVMRRGVRG
jgi:glycosyltransferase involved in cell wall biosynthesis